MTELSTDFKKWLTEEVLGECWHGDAYIDERTCSKCGKDYVDTYNRTYDNWNDYGAVIDKIQRKDWFEKFLVYANTVKKTSIEFSDKEGTFYEQPYRINLGSFGKVLRLDLINPIKFFSTLQEWWEKEIFHKP